MDDEWSKGCECTESTLLPFSPLPSFFPLSRSWRERNRRRTFSPGEHPGRDSVHTCIYIYISDRPVYGAAMMEPTSERSCTFRPGYKLVIFYEFYIARHARQEFSGSFEGGYRRFIVREDIAIRCPRESVMLFFTWRTQQR